MNKCALRDGYCSHQRKVDILQSVDATKDRLIETFRVIPMDVWLIELTFEELKEDIRKKFEEVDE